MARHLLHLLLHRYLARPLQPLGEAYLVALFMLRILLLRQLCFQASVLPVVILLLSPCWRPALELRLRLSLQAAVLVCSLSLLQAVLGFLEPITNFSRPPVHQSLFPPLLQFKSIVQASPCSGQVKQACCIAAGCSDVQRYLDPTVAAGPTMGLSALIARLVPSILK